MKFVGGPRPALSRRAVSAGLSLVLAMALVVASQTAASSLDPWHEPPPLELSAGQVSSDACPWVGSVVRTQKFTAEQTGSTAFGHTWTHVVGHATAPVAGQTCGTSWRTWDKDTGWEVDTTDPDCTRTRNYAGEGFTAGSGELELSIGGGVGGVWHARVVALGGEYEYSGSETRTNCGETTTFPLTPMQFADISDDECARIQVPSATVQAFRYTCVRDFPAEPVEIGDGTYTSKYRYVTEGSFRRAACDTSVDTDAGGVSDCAEYDAGTDPLVAADDRSPSPSPTPSPTQTCPPVKPLAPALQAAASDDVGSREVSFRLDDAAVNAAGFAYVLAYGDGTTAPILPGAVNSHTYAAAGEYEATLVMTYPPNCVSDPRTFDVVADPVTTYAPSVHLHPDEKYFPDSVSPFLSAAVLVHDLPNYRSGGGGPLSRPGCRDVVVARGPSADLDRLREARPSTKVPRRVPFLDRGRLGGRSGQKAYGAREHGFVSITTGCIARDDRYRAHQNGAAKAGSSKSKDDGLVLSLAGAAPKYLRGDTALKRAKLYVDYRAGRYIAYWIWYPYNSWKSNPGPVTEKHEGDWEHVTVKLDSFSGLMTTVGYYQHYCAAKPYSRHELSLEEGTHPPVWPAKGGHASYQKNVGRKTVGSCWKRGPNGPTDTTGAGGKVWRTWKPTAAGGSRLVDARKEPWYGFEGAWGDPREANFANYGPQAPGGQTGDVPSGW